MNLIGNALKYTEQGTVQCDYKLSGNKLLLSVQDTWIGIPADKLSDIFERIVRLERKYSFGEICGWNRIGTIYC